MTLSAPSRVRPYWEFTQFIDIIYTSVRVCSRLYYQHYYTGV